MKLKPQTQVAANYQKLAHCYGLGYGYGLILHNATFRYCAWLPPPRC